MNALALCTGSDKNVPHKRIRVVNLIEHSISVVKIMEGREMENSTVEKESG
jgi:hypothetical protein